MGVPYLFELVSPERTPDKVVHWAHEAASRGLEVLIVASSGSAPLAGMVAANTPLPVIGLPLDGTPLRGADSLYSMVQMPVGAPVACVGINASENAAILAARMLTVKHPHFNRVLQHQAQNANVRQDTALQEIRGQFPDLTDPRVTAPEDNRLFLTEQETDPNFLFREEEEEADEKMPGEAEVVSDSSPRKSVAGKPDAEAAQPHEPSPPTSRGGRAGRDRSEITTESDVEEELKAAKGGGKKKKGTSADAAPPAPPAPVSAPPDPVKTAGHSNGLGTAPPSTQSPAATSKPATEDKSEEQKGELGGMLFARRTNKRPLADRLFRIAPDRPDVDVIEHAMFTLLEGGIVAVPTDTVYGIAVDATNAEAVERLYRLKGRSRQKALAILVHNTDMLSRLVTRFPERVEELIEEFWPGSLTVIFPKPLGALAGVSATRSIGVRIPDHNTTLALISMIARPLATTSANLSGEPAATTAEEVISVFGDSLDCILDAGPAPGTVASTVLSVVEEPYQILREGAVSRSELEKVLGDLLAKPE